MDKKLSQKLTVASIEGIEKLINCMTHEVNALREVNGLPPKHAGIVSEQPAVTRLESNCNVVQLPGDLRRSISQRSSRYSTTVQ